MLNEDSSLEELKSYLFAGAGARLEFTPEEALNFIVALDEERQVDGAEAEQRSSLVHRRNNRKRKRKVHLFCRMQR